MSDTNRGLYRKYKKIERTDGSSEPGGKHENCSYFGRFAALNFPEPGEQAAA